MTGWNFRLFACNTTINGIRLLGSPHSSSGYGIIQQLSIQVRRSSSNSAISCFGTKYSAALFSSSGGIWFSEHFHDTTQIFLFWSNSAWKSDLLIVMAAHTGLSSCGTDNYAIHYKYGDGTGRNYSGGYVFIYWWYIYQQERIYCCTCEGPSPTIWIDM